ncbi:hypothetical protein AAXE64_07605 [Priestia megaterium]
MSNEKFVIEEYIDAVEFTKEGILIQYQHSKDELIKWDDERIKHFIKLDNVR